MTEPQANNIVFICHNAVDRPYAQALEGIIHALLENKDQIVVRYSTSERVGPEGGEQWREWIHKRVVEARTTLIVVTPHALGKPWLLWEAGAVKGAALARGVVQTATVQAGATTPPSNSIIVSLAYGIPDSECPDPLRGEQIIRGTDPEPLKGLCLRILQAHQVGGEILFRAGAKFDLAFEAYRTAVNTAMKRAPSLSNEANVQDWLVRIDALANADRLSELGGFERWMMLAFGRDAEEGTRSDLIPIDVRLHRRLGELHLGQKEYRQAVRQLRLAWRAAPRDIFILRPLAEASMKNLLEAAGGEDESARAEIDALLRALKDLDDRADITPEAAGLQGKYYRRVRRDPDAALQIYKKAFDANPNSYYLVDLLAQTQLEVGQHDAARSSFTSALQIIERLREDNIWSHATAATAYVGLGHVENARDHLATLRKAEPLSESQIDTIACGIREVAERVGIAPDHLQELLFTLDPRRARVVPHGVDATQA
jgi:tetratricopeptide (TPR) repeat protein